MVENPHSNWNDSFKNMFIIVLAWALSLLPSLCNSEKAPHYSFVHEATSAPAMAHFDYIIVGGGTCGCSLAATLSQGAKVLVLERGGSPYGNAEITDMGNFITLLTSISPDSPAQMFISEDGVMNTRARVLGGGSALNAGFYSRASMEYVKEAGWDAELVNKSYEWVEKKVAFQPRTRQWQSAVRDALVEVGVTPYNGFTYDHVRGTKIGGTIFDGDGQRHTAADLLEYAEPNNTTVYLHAVVHKICFEHTDHQTGKPLPTPRANGVIYQDENGCWHEATLSRNAMNEIIVSAGAMGSPQLLMLSGIGPAGSLAAHGIDVVIEQPMVGQGMADNPMNLLYIPSPLPVEVSLVQVVGITPFGAYIEAASGLSLPILSTLLNNATTRGGVILEKIAGPASRGRLQLRTTNPNDNPDVAFNYFAEAEDLERCVRGMKTIIDVILSSSFSAFRYQNISVASLINLVVSQPVNLRPRHLSSSVSLEQFCFDTVMTIWHYHGGCQVGRVVDHDYKVLGTGGLRIVDGSTFLNSPGTNPQATVMMLGRYMGTRILQQRVST